MSLLELVILSIGLAMDAFAVSICKGLAMKSINMRKASVCVVCYPSSRHFKYRKIFGFCRPVLGGIFMLLTSFYHDTPLA